ncbi:hypothetical protein M404DRAFT_992581 [Pisolithus tinctorius Marx 270]|uniref:Uncharacterized protein n=1 Tax=Pisolithus tinctorius Marx 270 TaxID=870435 RepID=A0A0C3PJG8_PISTI|nr:hypothetical protein M404DRAFT_992581 [Pisolithus tinctorius Marx 270]
MAVYISFDSGTLLGIRVRQSLDPGYSNVNFHRHLFRFGFALSIFLLRSDACI